MFRAASRTVLRKPKKFELFKNYATSEANLPNQADIVIIGGGSIGCSILYHLAKRGINAVLLEQAKLTSGTTWHTSGLHWRLRPNDVEIQLLASTKETLESLEDETGLASGYTNNGGLFIARTKERIQEYQRLHTIGHFFGIDSQILTPEETLKYCPILDPNNFTAALYSPGDGYIDPSMFCAALTKGATKNGGKVIENCSVTKLILDRSTGTKKIVGIETTMGTIKTSYVVNACGAWSRNIANMAGVPLPLSAMKHAYIITDTLPGIKGSPNIRDHDYSVYFRIQGDATMIGGYEPNPEILREAPNDFAFSLFDLDHSIFDVHMQNASKLCPSLNNIGIKSSVCGVESFTPDHKPLMGEDPKCYGLYHACGFNSAGLMLSAGCAEQLAIWMTKGRPDLPMFSYDIRRFTTDMSTDRAWVTETSHESYAKNYAVVFPFDQFLSGRNFKIDPFHEVLVARGAVMGQAQGWERPEYFIQDSTAPVRGYDWYGYYDHVVNYDQRYVKQLQKDYTFNFSKNHELIGEEALAARNNVALFNLSYFTKCYLTGPDAQEAADWLFTANTDREPEKVVYTCSLNSKGGVEADMTVMPLVQGVGRLVGPILKGKGYYICAGGASGFNTISNLRKQLFLKKYKSVISDVTDRLGILSIQGPKSGELLQSVTETPITDENFPFGMSHLVTINGHTCRAMRISYIGELGYELHIPVASCIPIYNKIEDAGRSFDMKFAGYRALYSLSCEKGFHLWHRDLRSNDNPIESGLGFLCRKDGPYQGKDQVERLRAEGIKKRRCFFTIPDKTIAVYGLETIWRDDAIVGFLRRGEYAYHLDCSVGIGFVEHPKGEIITDKFLKSGRYEIEVLGTRYPANIHTQSPFDPKNLRMLGQYEQNFQEQAHFED